jgi:hypothetical protein
MNLCSSRNRSIAILIATAKLGAANILPSVSQRR